MQKVKGSTKTRIVLAGYTSACVT